MKKRYKFNENELKSIIKSLIKEELDMDLDAPFSAEYREGYVYQALKNNGINDYSLMDIDIMKSEDGQKDITKYKDFDGNIYRVFTEEELKKLARDYYKNNSEKVKSLIKSEIKSLDDIQPNQFFGYSVKSMFLNSYIISGAPLARPPKSKYFVFRGV